MMTPIPGSYRSNKARAGASAALQQGKTLRTERAVREAIWPAQSVAILERNWGRKSVAELIGKSRNAVIGKAHRLGLPRLK